MLRLGVRAAVWYAGPAVCAHAVSLKYQPTNTKQKTDALTPSTRQSAATA